MLAVLTLLSFFMKSLNAQHLDIGVIDGEYTLVSKSYINGLIVDARSSEVDMFGLGYGYQEKHLEFYLGVGYTSNDEVYYFTECVYKNERHSIYDLSLDYVNDRPELSLGYTHLLGDSYGLIAKHNFTSNKLFLGLRKWF